MEHRWPVLFLTIAATSWWAGQTLLPDMGLAWPERLAAVGRHQDRQVAAAALLLVAGWAMVLSAVSLAWSSHTPRRSRMVVLGIAGLGVGGVWLAAGRGAFSMHLLQSSRDGVGQAEALAVLDASQGYAFFALLPTLPALLVGPLLLAIGLRRAGRSGWLPLFCWVVGIGAFIASEFTFKAGESAGVAAAGVALVLMGRAAGRSDERPDEDVGDTSIGRTLTA